jgi:hypothetical protein
MPHDFERAVGDDLVRVHVGRRAGPALDDVDHELVVQAAVADFGAGGGDRVAIRTRQQPELAVRVGGRP